MTFANSDHHSCGTVNGGATPPASSRPSGEASAASTRVHGRKRDEQQRPELCERACVAPDVRFGFALAARVHVRG